MKCPNSTGDLFPLQWVEWEVTEDGKTSDAWYLNDTVMTTLSTGPAQIINK